MINCILRYLFDTNKSLTHDYVQIITQVLMLERKCKLHTKICLREVITIKQSYCQLSCRRPFTQYIICRGK